MSAEPADIVLRVLPRETACRFAARCVALHYRIPPALVLCVIGVVVVVVLTLAALLLALGVTVAYGIVQGSFEPEIVVAILFGAVFLVIPGAPILTPGLYDRAAHRAVESFVLAEGDALRTRVCPDCFHDQTGTRGHCCPECGSQVEFERPGA